jgi:hypothetical protein
LYQSQAAADFGGGGLQQDVGRFQTAFATIMRGNMDALKKPEKKKEERKDKKEKKEKKDVPA